MLDLELGPQAGRRQGILNGSLLVSTGFFARDQVLDGAGEVFVGKACPQAGLPVFLGQPGHLGVIYRAVFQLASVELQRCAGRKLGGFVEQRSSRNTQVARGTEVAALGLA
ncbi:hypothetical protein D3C77_362540 [compost metagenome]